ncbi:MAG: aspartate-semialdehyde dehydrogenase [Candidatus Hydrothermarchaeales archaeon]
MKVAILGATGMVGQRFIEMLEGHPFFELTDLAASSRSAGKTYKNAAKWYLDGEMPEELKDREVKEIDPKKIDADIVFSALPSGVAKDAEPAFAKEGFVVASNASSYRTAPDVPLLIPEVNPEHLDMVKVQKENRSWDGCIITNPNCTTVMFTLSLKPVFDRFGLKSVFLTSMQALSGAGYNGVPSMAIQDNVIPFIRGEEEKVDTEILKIFGEFNGSDVILPDFKVSTSCNRVAVTDGHMESVFVKTKEECSIEDIKAVMANFKALPQELDLPSAPKTPIIVKDEEDRPQPRLDRMNEGGMAVTVGRIREDPILDFKYTVLGHNTIRGAAGASVLNAEVLVKARKDLI